MSSDTARKVVLAFLLVGAVMTFATEPSAQRRYRKLWGMTLLGVAAAAMSDFAPAVVGPFVALVFVAYLAGHGQQIGSVTARIQRQAATG